MDECARRAPCDTPHSVVRLRLLYVLYNNITRLSRLCTGSQGDIFGLAIAPHPSLMGFAFPASNKYDFQFKFFSPVLTELCTVCRGL